MQRFATGLCIAALALTTALSAAPGASDARAGDKRIASYCSASGDVCYGVFARSGKVFLRITTAARYFKRYTLCVRLLPANGGGAEHLLRCGSFPIFRQSASTWGSSVNYARQYPVTTRGRYRVVWKLPSGPLGPALFFRLPPA